MTTVPEVREQHPLLRYANPAVALHWITAAFVIFQIWLGLSFADMARGPQRTELFAWHKTIGIAILLIVFIRLTYRLVNAPPPFPPELPRWELLAATWTHRLLYLLLIALPIGGYVAVSGHAKDGTVALLGGISLPALPVSESLGETAGELHSAGAWLMIALLVLHVAAALKQQFYDRPGRMAGRMPPFRPRTDEPVVSD